MVFKKFRCIFNALHCTHAKAYIRKLLSLYTTQGAISYKAVFQDYCHPVTTLIQPVNQVLFDSELYIGILSGDTAPPKINTWFHVSRVLGNILKRIPKCAESSPKQSTSTSDDPKALDLSSMQSFFLPPIYGPKSFEPCDVL